MNPTFANDLRCKNEILMGYQLAGAIRLVRTYYINETYLNNLVIELKGIKDLSGLYDFVPSPSLKNEIFGGGVSIESDSQIDIKELLNSKDKVSFLKSVSLSIRVTPHANFYWNKSIR